MFHDIFLLTSWLLLVVSRIRDLFFTLVASDCRWLNDSLNRIFMLGKTACVTWCDVLRLRLRRWWFGWCLSDLFATCYLMDVFRIDFLYMQGCWLLIKPRTCTLSTTGLRARVHWLMVLGTAVLMRAIVTSCLSSLWPDAGVLWHDLVVVWDWLVCIMLCAWGLGLECNSYWHRLWSFSVIQTH